MYEKVIKAYLIYLCVIIIIIINELIKRLSCLTCLIVIKHIDGLKSIVPKNCSEGKKFQQANLTYSSIFFNKGAGRRFGKVKSLARFGRVMGHPECLFDDVVPDSRPTCSPGPPTRRGGVLFGPRIRESCS